MNSFASETCLVDSFVGELEARNGPWGKVRFMREFDYQRGRTDVVALTEDGTIVAFEAKLTKWREAMHQAYRNRCFADSSLVILPKEVAFRASAYSAEFARRGVGICYYTQADGIVVVVDAARETPILPWLREHAVSAIES